MPDNNERYYGTYCKLENRNDTTEIKLDGNSVFVGNPAQLHVETHVTEAGKEKPRVIVARDEKMAIGFLPTGVAKRVIALSKKGWLVHAFPALVVFDKLNDSYWCEVALVAYPPEERAAFDPFVERLKERIAKGDHPEVALSDKQLDRVIETAGEWCDMPAAPLPSISKGSALYKTHRTQTESLAKTASNHGKGCMVAVVAVLVVVVLVILFLLGAL